GAEAAAAVAAAAAAAAELPPPCFICKDDITHWGPNAGNGEAISCARDGCGRVFHVTCVAYLLQDAAARTPGGCGAEAGTWECPLHRCACCGADENGLQLGEKRDSSNAGLVVLAPPLAGRSGVSGVGG
ncbi:unnamed protein product, partial [Ectocarpus sp. 13 AM-2016]